MLEFCSRSVVISQTLPIHTCSSALLNTDCLFSLLHANKNKYFWVSPSALQGKRLLSTSPSITGWLFQSFEHPPYLAFYLLPCGHFQDYLWPVVLWPKSLSYSYGEHCNLWHTTLNLGGSRCMCRRGLLGCPKNLCSSPELVGAGMWDQTGETAYIQGIVPDRS